MVKMIHDRKTGRLRRVNPRRSMIARRASRRRRGRHLSMAVRRKMAMTHRREARTHRTKYGRRFVIQRH